MKKFEGNLVVFDLKETYHELGQYTFKVVLNPSLFKDSHQSSVVMYDGSGKDMNFSLSKWGRKINCTFTLDNSVADGVCAVYLTLVNDKGETVPEFLSFWCIK